MGSAKSHLQRRHAPPKPTKSTHAMHLKDVFIIPTISPANKIALLVGLITVLLVIFAPIFNEQPMSWGKMIDVVAKSLVPR